MMGVNASFFALEGFHDNFFPKMEDDENLMFPWVDIHVPIAPLTEADLDHLAALAWSDHWAAIAWSVLATLADSLATLADLLATLAFDAANECIENP